MLPLPSEDEDVREGLETRRKSRSDSSSESNSSLLLQMSRDSTCFTMHSYASSLRQRPRTRVT